MSTDRRRWAALIVLCTGMLMIVLDLTVVNVALSAIQADLGFSDAGLAWVVNAYMIAFGGLLLFAGRLGDLLGRRRVFLAGLTTFSLASLGCGFAQNEVVLIGARFVQGIGGAMTSAVILGMIVTMFPEPREQARAIGAFAFVASAGGAVGLLAGGILTQAVNWHWIFFVNIPVAVVTAMLTVRLVPNEPGLGLGAGTDVLGAVTVTAALMLGVYAIVGPAATRGWTDPTTLGFGAGSLSLLGLFGRREMRVANPLVPMSIFRSRTVTAANLIQVLSVAGMFGIFFLGSLYLKKVLGYGPLAIGFAFLPTTVLMGALSVRYTEPLATRFGARRLLVTGLALIGAGLVVFAQAPPDGSYLVNVAPVMALLGIGGGLAFPSLMMLAMSGASGQNAGLASGLVNTTGQVGAGLGLAVLATLSASRTANLAAAGAPVRAALTGGFHLAFWVAATLVAAALAVAAFGLTSEPAAQREARTATTAEPVCV
jgi:EmrB/QacA subfamily drug resistance transporter